MPRLSLLTIGVSNTMTAGAAVAVLGPIVLKTAIVAGDDPIIIGFITAISSAFGYLTPAAQPGLHHHLCLGLSQRLAISSRSGIRMMVVSLILSCSASPASTGR